ncbi:MAG TPA: MFS transporter, partial [Usitatibacteraceae bacterium]|nr:MFS transporter [Usitatibacteraceae bacterium]
MTASQSRAAWSVTLAAAAILMVTMGVRQSQGLFISPINTSTGLGVVAISFAIAIGQFTWGAIQPIAGAVADKFGPAPVLAAGLVLLAAGMALTPFMSSGFGMVVSIGLLTAAGAGTGAFSVIIGAVGQQLAPERRGFSSGVINAGASVGQFVFAPLAQFLITAFGWMAALWSLAAVSLAALPLTRMLRGKPHAAPIAGATAEKTLRGALREAAQDRSYLLLHAGFFTCGFHIAFLVTHLPGEVQL